jgi:hypothetical protein
VTAPLEAPLTEAENKADWPLVIEISAGMTEILTNGKSEINADRVGALGELA